MKNATIPNFVFIDGGGRPFYVREIGGEIWMCYWGVNKNWVTLRKVGTTELKFLQAQAIPGEQAKLYHQMAIKNGYGA